MRFSQPVSTSSCEQLSVAAVEMRDGVARAAAAAESGRPRRLAVWQAYASSQSIGPDKDGEEFANCGTSLVAWLRIALLLVVGLCSDEVSEMCFGAYGKVGNPS